MSFDHLWAGWRSAYVESVSVPTDGDEESVETSLDPGGPERCVFCRLFASDAPDEERNVVFESERAVVVLNAYPYASGHVLAMPRRHVANLSELDAEESAELWAVVRSSVEAIEAAYAPGGMNLGANLGRAAGAGIPRHVHFHVLPRWVGDTNFMTAVASTRVLPEALSDTWSKLRAAWPR